MRNLATVIFLMAGFALKAQNLVPNSSFEEYYRLPCHLNVFTIQDLIKEWMQPIPTTSDYWNSLTDSSCFLHPANTSATVRTGNGMAGIITVDIQNGYFLEYKEYLEVKLSQTLVKGGFYNVEFFARNAQIAPYIDVLRSNNLGAAFTGKQIQNFPPNNLPDHLFLDRAVEEDKVVDDQWNKVGGCYISDSTYQYLLIGNFEPIDSTEVVRLTYNNTNAVAYYFIDDVRVEKLPYDISHLKPSVAYCPDQSSVSLNAFTAGAKGYLWEDGSAAPTLSVDAKVDKDYVVNILFEECTYEHVFRVRYIPPLDIGSDTLMCEGEVLVINPDHPLKDFQWSDQSTDTIRYITKAGNYHLKIPAGPCNIEDEINVDYIECPGFTPNVMTMNDDGLNETLVFEHIDNRIWSLEIFNRWGERVFYSEHYQNDWHAKDLSDGIYYYKLQCREPERLVKGWIELGGNQR